MKYTIEDLMSLYSECRADMQSAAVRRQERTFGIQIGTDSLARMYQRRNRFAWKLKAMICRRAAKLEAENEVLRNRNSNLQSSVDYYERTIRANEVTA